MSLVRLLTAGKSLVGLHEPAARYRLTTQRLLPRFEPKKNPFRERQKEEGRRQKEGAVKQEPVISNQKPGISDQRSVISNQEPVISDQRSEVSDKAAEAEVRSEAKSEIREKAEASNQNSVISNQRSEDSKQETQDKRVWRRWVEKLKGLRFRRAEKKPKTLVQRSSKAMVQAELSLDTVKVVRNDLSDTDLEVVTARPAAPQKELKPSLREPVERALSSIGWGKVTGRLFGAGKF